MLKLLFMYEIKELLCLIMSYYVIGTLFILSVKLYETYFNYIIYFCTPSGIALPNNSWHIPIALPPLIYVLLRICNANIVHQECTVPRGV